MKALCISTALLVFAGAGVAQPPTAPAPREVEFPNLTFTYSGPAVDAKVPKVEMEAKDGQIVVRWTMQETTCAAFAARAVVHDGVLSLVGTVKDPVFMSTTRGQNQGSQSGRRIDIVLADGTIKITDKPAP